MEFFNLAPLSFPTLTAFIIMVLVNAAVTRVAVQTIKGEVEKLEKKLEQLYTQLLKVSVLEARLGHIEKDLGKAQEKMETIEKTIFYRDILNE